MPIKRLIRRYPAITSQSVALSDTGPPSSPIETGRSSYGVSGLRPFDVSSRSREAGEGSAPAAVHRTTNDRGADSSPASRDRNETLTTWFTTIAVKTAYFLVSPGV